MNAEAANKAEPAEQPDSGPLLSPEIEEPQPEAPDEAPKAAKAAKGTKNLQNKIASARIRFSL